MRLLRYLALGALAAAVILGLPTDVQTAAACFLPAARAQREDVLNV